ncbi:head-tail joining protein [Thioclava kandeliae]|uniref:Head-tail adaptor protein n=1 Tax=Thioclava kandeliae TaxID=3070818 RepID=A0ABV1SIE8_9RHOB
MGVFDGMASVLSNALGAEVTYTPKGGVARSVQSVFREQPVEITGDDGRDVAILAPSWRVRRDLVPELASGDLVAPGNGKTYRVVNYMSTGSPAADAMILCQLEDL